MERGVDLDVSSKAGVRMNTSGVVRVGVVFVSGGGVKIDKKLVGGCELWRGWIPERARLYAQSQCANGREQGGKGWCCICDGRVLVEFLQVYGQLKCARERGGRVYNVALMVRGVGFLICLKAVVRIYRSRGEGSVLFL